MKLKQGLISAALVLTSTIVCSELFAQPRRAAIGPIRQAGPATKTEKPPIAWNEADLVILGRLDRVDAGPVAQSLPPIYSHTLHLHVGDVFRGDAKSGVDISMSHSARQNKPPKFPLDKDCIVAATTARGRIRVLRIEEADDDLKRTVQRECSLPLGWKAVGERAVSPWAALGDKAWNADAEFSSNVVCNVTGRPALFLGSQADLAVEPVPPKKSIKWTNPDGDGDYKVSVTNHSDQPISIPALLTDGEDILWAECLILRCQGQSYVCPGAKGVSGNVAPVQLKPGETISTTVNALRLDGPEWPRGGYRIEFQFCLGEQSQTMSFYYLSRHHDALRKAAIQSP